MIKAVIFDLGGVLTSQSGFWPFCHKYSRQFNMTPEELHTIIKKHWKPARIDEISSQEFWEKTSVEIGCDKNFFRKIMVDFQIVGGDTLQIARSLKGRYKLAILSNHIRDWFEEIVEKNKLKEIFDVIVTSYDFGAQKPDKSIYKETIEKLGLKPEECVFIDDKEKNIHPAKELGMKVILFKDVGQLKNELKELGVEF
ncbi:MAG: HAD family phosphatase [archaeon]|nr:MAG: HAD family phosphatase [archaeon]